MTTALEYKVFTVKFEHSQNVLNQLGAVGWLIAAFDRQADDIMIIVMRPAQQEPANIVLEDKPEIQEFRNSKG
jgi:hypothetical protein